MISTKAKHISNISSAFLMVFSLHFLFLVYPNDKRIDMQLTHNSIDRPPSILSTGLEVPSQKELFPGAWPDIKIDLSTKEYRKTLRNISDKSNHLIKIVPDRSTKFFANYSIGSFPDRLENRSGILIVSGSGVTLSPRKSGNFTLKYAAASVIHDADLKLVIVRNKQNNTDSASLFKKMTSNAPSLINQQLQKKSLAPLRKSASPKAIALTHLPRPLDPINESGFLQKNILRYWNVDRYKSQDDWIHTSQKINLSAGSQLRFECTSTKGHCFLSRPKIYRNSSARKNNFIVIVVDTLRSDAITKKSMPSLYSWSKHAAIMKNAIAVGNMTSPSTTGLLSCRAPSNIAGLAFSYGADEMARRQYYEEKKDSFPRVFQRNGWKTAMIGNISLLSEVLGSGVDHGFDQQIAIERDGYETALTTREALHWLENSRNEPFFLYLHYHAPHAPYRAPISDILSSFESWRDLTSMPDLLRWLYRAETRYTDRYLTTLFREIKTLGLEETTNIVVTADHGEQHSVREYSANSAGPVAVGAFFDHGATLLNDEIHIPMIFKGPSFSKTTNINRFVSNLDIATTLLDSASLATPLWCDGDSLLPEITADRKSLAANTDGDGDGDGSNRSMTSGTQKMTNKDVAIQHDTNLTRSKKYPLIGSEGFQRRSIIFENRYKYTVSYSETVKYLYRKSEYSRNIFNLFQDRLLVDLKNDPNEAINIISSHPEIRRRAQFAFDTFFGKKRLWELIVESPDKQKIEITLAERNNLPIKYQGTSPSLPSKPYVFVMQNSRRSILTFDKPFVELPTVMYFAASDPDIAVTPAAVSSKSILTPDNNSTATTLNSNINPLSSQPTPVHSTPAPTPIKRRVAVTKTYAKIPLRAMGDQLPLEYIGEASLMEVGKQVAAYYRKVDWTNSQIHKPTAGNQKFEKIMRDWGYVNDN